MSVIFNLQPMVTSPFEAAINEHLKLMDDRLYKMEQKINAIDSAISINLKSMDTRYCNMEQKMVSIDINMAQIVSALLGNSLTAKGGLIDEIECIKKEVDYLKQNACDKEEIRLLKLKSERLEKFRDRFGWTIITVISLAVVAEYIINFVLKLIAK